MITGEGESTEELLAVWIRIRNASERKKLYFRGWQSGGGIFSSMSTLEDDFGNNNPR
jgi:hypothetical protein